MSERRQRRLGGILGRTRDDEPQPRVDEPDPMPPPDERPPYLRLAVDPGIGAALATEVARALRDAVEHDHLRFVPPTDDADIRLRLAWPGEHDIDGIETIDVGRDQLMVVSRHDLGDAGVRVTTDRLVDLELVAGPTGPLVDRPLLKLLSRPAHRPTIRHRFSDTLTALSFLVAEDEAFMVMPRTCTKDLPDDLAVHPLGEEPIFGTVRIEASADLADDDEAFPIIVAIHGVAERA